MSLGSWLNEWESWLKEFGELVKSEADAKTCVLWRPGLLQALERGVCVLHLNCWGQGSPWAPGLLTWPCCSHRWIATPCATAATSSCWPRAAWWTWAVPWATPASSWATPSPTRSWHRSSSGPTVTDTLWGCTSCQRRWVTATQRCREGRQLQVWLCWCLSSLKVLSFRGCLAVDVLGVNGLFSCVQNWDLPVLWQSNIQAFVAFSKVLGSPVLPQGCWRASTNQLLPSANLSSSKGQSWSWSETESLLLWWIEPRSHLHLRELITIWS